MTLQAGTRIGPYHILAPLGAGGMGEVYRARDTRLRRDVALKMLPEASAVSADALARFEREALSLAALNHPHIAQIYGLEEAPVEGVEPVPVRALIMELVPGETLASRLRRGALAVQEALDLARQVAEGLEAAHEKGIVHRDLKPGNIQVTPDGRVKILDFGLAKALGGPEPSALVEEAVTVTAEPTVPGAMVGTPAYMSPEQARGLIVDTRTDIWAFGCVLYECLTGHRAFDGQTATDSLAAVLDRDPDWLALPAGLSPAVRVVLQRCLRKDARDRLRDIGDVRIELTEVLSGGSPSGADAGVQTSGADVPAGQRARSVWRHPLTLGLAVLVLVLASAVVSLMLFAPTSGGEPGRVTRLSVVLPPGRQLADRQTSIAMSPDGGELALMVQEDLGRAGPLDDSIQVYRRLLDGFAVEPVPGTAMAMTPFYAPSGDWLGLYGGSGGLRKVSLHGGTPLPIVSIPISASSISSAAWTDDDRVLYASDWALFRVAAAGGTPEALITREHLQADELFVGYPSPLPEGRGFLVQLIGLDPSRSRVGVWSEGRLTRLSTVGLRPSYLPTGHLLYLRQAEAGSPRFDAYAAPFDLQRLEVTGPEVPVLENVRHGQYATSATGTLAYNASGVGETIAQLTWLAPDGTSTPLSEATTAESFVSPRFSPDGTRIAFASGRSNADTRLRVRTLATGVTRIIGSPATWWNVWTPDGRNLVYIRKNDENATGNLYRRSADGSGQEERLTTSEHHQPPLFVTPDGRTLVFHEESPATGYDLWQLRLEGDRTPQPLLQTKANERLATISREHPTHIAYASDETGRDEVWVRRWMGAGAAVQVSTQGGTGPLWSPDGTTLFYRDAAATRLFMVPVTWTPEPSFGTPTTIDGWWLADLRYGRNYDVMPDGSRLVTILTTSTAGSEVAVVLNWFEELKARLSAAR